MSEDETEWEPVERWLTLSPDGTVFQTWDEAAARERVRSGGTLWQMHQKRRFKWLSVERTSQGGEA